MPARSITVCLGVALVGGCGGPRVPDTPDDSAEQAQEQLGGVVGEATVALDPQRCKEGDNRLRPFVVSWDATTQAEFSAQGQDSLLLVKLDGCKLTLLPQCRIAGEYRMRNTPGGFQILQVGSEAELYGKLSFSVAKLGAHLKMGKTLSLKYFVRGLRYATAPALYQSDLPRGCSDATHFVLNYAAGAYQLAAGVGQSVGSDIEVGRQGIGAGAREDAAVLFRGGKMASCENGKFECTAPVRLRLLPVLEGEPGKRDIRAHRRALSSPQKAKAVHKLTREEAHCTIRSARKPLRKCAALDDQPSGSYRVKTTFTIGLDGVVEKVTMKSDANTPATLVDCMTTVFYGLRFPAPGETTTVNYPFHFTIVGERPKKIGEEIREADKTTPESDEEFRRRKARRAAGEHGSGKDPSLAAARRARLRAAAKYAFEQLKLDAECGLLDRE